MTQDISSQERVRFTHLAETALSQYDLQIAEYHFLNKSDGVTFHINPRQPGNEYVLRIHNEVGEYRDEDYHRKEMIWSSLAWLEALDRQSDIVVQAPVENRDGDWVSEIADDRSERIVRCTVLRWVEGEIISGEHTQESAHQVGALMAKMHEHASQWIQPEGFVRPLYDGDRFAQGLVLLAERTSAEILTPEYKAVLADVVECLQGQMRSLTQDRAVWGPMHGDLGWPENVVFHQGDIRPIDFNGCSVGHYLCDIAKALAYVIAPCRASFFTGYNKIRPLSASDRAMVDAFQVGVGLLLLAGWSKNRPEQMRRLAGFIEGPCAGYLRGDADFLTPW